MLWLSKLYVSDNLAHFGVWLGYGIGFFAQIDYPPSGEDLMVEQRSFLQHFLPFPEVYIIRRRVSKSFIIALCIVASMTRPERFSNGPMGDTFTLRGVKK